MHLRPAPVRARARAVAAIVCGAVLALGIVAGCSTDNERAAGAPVEVVATGNFWGDIAAQIGGDRVRVRSIVDDAGADPHLYEAGASDAGAVADADLVIVNGLGYDDAIARLAADRDRETTLDVAEVLAAPDDANPHLWYDIPRAPDVAQAIAQRLTELDPGGRDTYARNLAGFRTALQPAINRIGEIRNQHAGARIANTERVAGYLIDDMGLVDASPPGFAIAIEDGNEPSAADTQAMNSLLRSKNVTLLVYNEQAESAVTEGVAAIARDGGVPVVGVTETLPAGLDYQTWQLRQIEALQAALGR